MVVEAPEVVGVDGVLKASKFVVELVGFGVREVGGEEVANFVVAGEDGLGVGDAFFDALHDIFVEVEFGLLWQVADTCAFGNLALTHELGIETGKDTQEG